MNALIGKWSYHVFLTGNFDSGKFIKFLEDGKYILNDGLEQGESEYKIISNNRVVLEPVLGLLRQSKEFEFKVEMVGDKEVLRLISPELTITYTFLKK